MQIKPLDLYDAHTAGSITNTKLNSYHWSPLHRLVTEDRRLLLKSTDGSIWVEWEIPFEGEPFELDVGIRSIELEHLARFGNGGRLTLSTAGSAICFARQQFQFVMDGTDAATYPEIRQSDPSDDDVDFSVDATKLGDSLSYISDFIDEKNPAAEKQVATLFASNGQLIAGKPKKLGIVDGLETRIDISFSKETACQAAQFFRLIGGDARFTASNEKYVISAPDLCRQITIQGKSERYPRERVLQRLNQTVPLALVDRKTLLSRARCFAGTLPTASSRLDLLMRGSNDQASLIVKTPGRSNLRSKDEFGIFRSAEDELPLVDTKVAIDCKKLISALKRMQSTTFSMQSFPRISVLREVPEPGDICRSVLITTTQLAQADIESVETAAPAVISRGSTPNGEDGRQPALCSQDASPQPHGEESL
jgi:hypothetical protein